jgi:cytidylate kinase
MQNSPVPVIAIDGTAASGKGTLARRLAAHLDYGYLDSGLLYRAVAYMLIAKNSLTDDKETAVKAARMLDPEILNHPDLRSAEVGRRASVVAAMPEVRQALDLFQHNFPAACGKAGAIVDGRDIGTVIFPDAKFKFYIDADQRVRSERRHRELLARGETLDFETVHADMQIRDARDSGRAFRPMVAAADAVKIDTTNLDPDAVFVLALSHLK